MLARENEEQVQEKSLEQFEQSLEHLDEAGTTECSYFGGCGCVGRKGAQVLGGVLGTNILANI